MHAFQVRIIFVLWKKEPERKGRTKYYRPIFNTGRGPRQNVLRRRDMDDIHWAVDYLNTTTHWVQSKASEDQLEDITDDLLLAMHDLRTVLVRKKADRLMKG